MKNGRLKVGISVGDPNGIGVEVILKTFQNKEMLSFFTPVIFGSTKLLSYQKNIFKLNSLPFQGIFKAEDAISGKINVVNLWKDDVSVEFGKVTEESIHMAKSSLDAAIDSLEKGEIDVLVMAPMNSDSFATENLKNSYEYLENKLQRKLLILVQDETLRVAMISYDTPLSEVSSKLTKEGLKQKIKTFHTTLMTDFCIAKPKIAVLGLNSHTGEGLNSKEEEDIINPVIKEYLDKGVLTFGPYPADNFFVSPVYEAFDGIVAMYHDQGMIPFNTLTIEKGVIIAAGLPYVITAPAHGTAQDIAGQGTADHLAFEQAIFDAVKIYRIREEYEVLKENTLQKISIEDIDSTIDEDLPEEER